MRQFFFPHVGASHRHAGEAWADRDTAVRFSQANRIGRLDVVTVENEGTEAVTVSRAVVAVPEPAPMPRIERIDA